MKSLRFMLPLSLLSLGAVALAQSTANTTAPSEAQKSFEAIKGLAGTWQGTVTTTPKMEGMGDGGKAQITMRITSRGNALVHEMKEAGTPDDPAKYDHPVTMFYVDGDRFLLTHYCDAGNRPRMAGKMSPDGRKVEFGFVDLTGGTQFGHMDHAVFTFIDANHHIEEWTYLMPGDKPVVARVELQRAQ